MKYTVLETFVGAGGSHLGFKNNGFKSVFVNDIDDNALKTLLHNNHDIERTAVVSNEDIMLLDGDKILKETGLKQKEADVMFGGIVCKGFSLAGERSPNDPRNVYYHFQLQLVNKIKPKISVIENVPGIINAKILKDDTPLDVKEKVDILWKKLENFKGYKANARKIGGVTAEIEELGSSLRKDKDNLLEFLHQNNYLISVKQDILDIYEKMGYKVFMKVLNSAWYGASTKRDRIIIVAVRGDVGIDYIFPEPLYKEDKYFKTVADALNLIDYTIKDIDNQPMKHSPKTIERFKYVSEGENLAKKIDQLPEELKISKFYSRGSTMRLDSKKCSPTLVPGHSNFPIHPYYDRVITVREAATITGFPIDYKFFGSHTKRCEQVGNAVPPSLSTAIAKECKNLLDRYYDSIK